MMRLMNILFIGDIFGKSGRELARRAMAEAQGFYPVPRFMGQAQCEAILHKMLS